MNLESKPGFRSGLGATRVLHILERLGVPDLPEVDLGVWDYMLLNT